MPLLRSLKLSRDQSVELQDELELFLLKEDFTKCSTVGTCSLSLLQNMFGKGIVRHFENTLYDGSELFEETITQPGYGPPCSPQLIGFHFTNPFLLFYAI